MIDNAGLDTTSVPTGTDTGVQTDTPMDAGTTASSEGEVTTTPAYTPNFNYKFAVEGSKQAEAEVDDLFKPLIKDAETEKKIRELHEKAYGLDFIKKDRDGIRQWATQLNEEHQSQTQALQTMGQYIKNDDLDSFFEVVGIPEKKVMEYAIKKAQYYQLPPEQRQAWDNQTAERQRIASLEMENQELTQNFTHFSVQQRENEVGNLLSHPQIADTVNSFDQRAGMPGAFRNEVVKRGQYYAQQGEDKPAQQVIMEVLNLVGWSPQQQQQQQPVPMQAVPKPVLPNIAGKGTSPVKKLPRNLDDLRKLSAQMSAGQ